MTTISLACKCLSDLRVTLSSLRMLKSGDPEDILTQEAIANVHMLRVIYYSCCALVVLATMFLYTYIKPNDKMIDVPTEKPPFGADPR